MKRYLILLMVVLGLALISAVDRPTSSTKPKQINSPTVTIDGNAGIYHTTMNSNIALNLTIDEGQEISWSVENSAGSGYITINFPGTLYWRDGTKFDTVDFGEVNIYTFLKINNKIFVASVTDLKQ